MEDINVACHSQQWTWQQWSSVLQLVTFFT
jgi:hypothetical protein